MWAEGELPQRGKRGRPGASASAEQAGHTVSWRWGDPCGRPRAAIKAAPTSVLNGRYGRERQAGAAGALRSKPPPPEDHQENSLGEVPRRGNRNSPFLAVSRGGLLRRGKSESPALTGSFAPFWPLRKGPAGGMTRKQIRKRFPWKAFQPGIRRADVGIGPY